MVSLTGKIMDNPLNLTGKPISLGSITTLDMKVEQLKRKIINKFIIPILQNKWEVIYDNIFIISIYRKELKYFKGKYDVEFYNYILTFIERIYNEHEELAHLEKMIYSNNTDASRLLYKTTMIRVAVEYEIYHSLFGIPKDKTYDNFIINKIREYMMQDDITFTEIKLKIEELYK